MKSAYIIGDTGRSIVVSFVSNDEEILRKDFPYYEGLNKPSVVEMARKAGDAFLKNTEFFRN